MAIKVWKGWARLGAAVLAISGAAFFVGTLFEGCCEPRWELVGPLATAFGALASFMVVLVALLPIYRDHRLATAKTTAARRRICLRLVELDTKMEMRWSVQTKRVMLTETEREKEIVRELDDLARTEGEHLPPDELDELDYAITYCRELDDPDPDSYLNARVRVRLTMEKLDPAVTWELTPFDEWYSETRARLVGSGRIRFDRGLSSPGSMK